MSLQGDNPVPLGRESLPKNEADREERRTGRLGMRQCETGGVGRGGCRLSSLDPGQSKFIPLTSCII